MIIHYAKNAFEETNPVGFADWMKERDDITGGNLRKVIRLFKWLRDYKNTFSCPSIILTVMLGNRVRYWDSDTRFADIPTTLVHLLEDLVTWLDGHLTMPLLDDPSCPGTSFNHRWKDPAKYETFKKKAADYATWAREAYDLQDDDDQAALVAWQKMFRPRVRRRCSQGCTLPSPCPQGATRIFRATPSAQQRSEQRRGSTRGVHPTQVQIGNFAL